MSHADSAAGEPIGDLLVTLCRRDVGRKLRPSHVAVLSNAGDRERFLLLAAQHRVSGLALTSLCGSGFLESMNGDAAPTCARHLRGLRRRAASIDLELDHLLDVLEATRSSPVVLKGGALTGSVYDEAVERDLADLDFLVPVDRVKATVRAFLDQGYAVPPDLHRPIWTYRRHHFHIPLEKAGYLRAEIHWALDRSGALARLDPVRILDTAIDLVRPGRPTLRCPRPEHMILHLVLQNCHEGFGRLSRFVDIDRILSGDGAPEWDRLIAAAHETGLASPTALTLHICAVALGTSIPEALLAELRPGPVARFHIAIMRPLDALLEEAGEAPGTDRLLRLWLIDDVPGRLRYLRSMLAPDVSFPPRKDPPGLSDRLLRLAALLFLQGSIHARTLVGCATARGRSQIRFWSRKASSSDRR